jgi:hypothetical protein
MEGIQHRLDCPAATSGGLPPPDETVEAREWVGDFIIEYRRCDGCRRAALIHYRARGGEQP